MTMKNYISIILILLLLTSCFKDVFDNNNERITLNEIEDIQTNTGTFTSKKPLWQTSITNNRYCEFWLDLPLIYDDYIISGEAWDDGGNEFVALDIETGEILWQELFKPFRETGRDVEISELQYYNDEYLICEADKNIKRYNLKDGKLQWHTDFAGAQIDSWITGTDDNFFFSGVSIKNTKSYSLQSIYIGNNETGAIEEILTPDFSHVSDTSQVVQLRGYAGGFDHPYPYIDNNNNINIVFITWCNARSQSGEFWFGIYNYTQNKLIYDSIPLKNMPVTTPQVHKNRIYFANYGDLSCYDLKTGELIWRKEYPNRFGPNYFLIYDDIMFVNQEGADVYMLAVDTETGDELWRVPSGGFVGVLQIENDVLYFCSMLTSKLYAIDIRTGKQYWAIESPDRAYDDIGWKIGCTVVPGKNGEKGRVIASTFQHVYCYEAVR